jgi:hypothetical protein
MQDGLCRIAKVDEDSLRLNCSRIFSLNLFARAPSPWHNPEPVREEFFSADHIEEHARSLAAAQKVTAKPSKGHPLAGRLAENGAVLLAAYKSRRNFCSLPKVSFLRPVAENDEFREGLEWVMTSRTTSRRMDRCPVYSRPSRLDRWRAPKRAEAALTRRPS